MSENYLTIMIQSLQKKEQLLDQILILSREQKDWIEDPQLTPEEFEQNIEKKAALIEQLDGLDAGFESLYEKMADELNANKEKYSEEICTMKTLITQITDKSMEIQRVEAQNKMQVEQRFTNIRKQIKQVRDSQKIVKEYYRNMQKLNYVDPQFMDNKK
ncbi:MAG: flagellar export chaperone FlgN [Roseburia sp.]